MRRQEGKEETGSSGKNRGCWETESRQQRAENSVNKAMNRVRFLVVTDSLSTQLGNTER